MNEAMTLVETVRGDVWVTRAGEDVELEALDQDGVMRGFVSLALTPGQAVELSRALVAAAAEALGVKV